jgi:hypothetical protein
VQYSRTDMVCSYNGKMTENNLYRKVRHYSAEKFYEVRD